MAAVGSQMLPRGRLPAGGRAALFGQQRGPARALLLNPHPMPLPINSAHRQAELGHLLDAAALQRLDDAVWRLTYQLLT